ncbi:MAG: class I SAM-dependent methyltransferase [Actinomycetota bacterium]|nr:class I SAM-dependent methyltransferase [Actinomycetota bacterium]
MAHDEPSTRDAGYTSRLVQLEGARWKKLLDVQAPYRRNLQRLLGGRAVLDVGCGIGRNLAQLGPGSVGVDHNADSVRICRERGLHAVVPDEFFGSADAVLGSFTGLLAAHLVEHLEPGTASEALRPYLAFLAPQARVVLICPQERGFASDPTHTEYYDLPALAALCVELGLEVESQSSFPFPSWAGRFFTYNEFVTVARTPAR